MPKQIASLCRRLAGCNLHDNVRVEMIPGDDTPHITGNVPQYYTRGGRRIHHPSAYSRFGWSNMVYRGSTRAVQVGASWLDSAIG